MSDSICPVILAGGGGTRLWPLSRGHFPKQFLKVVGDSSLLQDTLQRLAGLEKRDPTRSVDNPLVICNEEHRFLVAEQARVQNQDLGQIVLEPVGRNTAPALTVAALMATEAEADPLLLMMPADHVIVDVDAFQQAVLAAAELAEAGHLVTFGIVPDRPETGYGYINGGDSIPVKDSAVVARAVERFVEKPNAATAEEYVRSGDYLWNSGIFMMRATTWLKAIGRLRPDIGKAVELAHANGQADGEFFRVEAKAFESSPSDSIDYAVMEKLGDHADLPAAVIALDAGWSDVGSWQGLWQIAEGDAQGNVVNGDVIALESTNNLIRSEHRLVAVLGCEDLVVIETADAVLVAPKDRTQEVRKLVDDLAADGRDERLMHRRVYRPWGSYEGIDAGERFQVKRIIVNPGQSLSLQMHHHRAEHWIVVSGTAKVTNGDEEFLLAENESTYIPIGATHRLVNPGTIPLELIEVQSGSYLGEDDIVRFEDKYNRQ